MLMQQVVDSFGFNALWNPQFALFSLVFVIIYFMVLPGRRHASWYRQAGFLLGFAALVLSFGGPLRILGHLVFRYEAMQIAALTLIVPPLLWNGFVREQLAPLKRYPWLQKLALRRPYLSVAAFAVLLYIYFIPPVFTKVMSDSLLYFAYLLALFCAALWTWLPIAGPVRRFDTRKQRVYYAGTALAASLPIGFMLLVSDSSWFHLYTDPEIWANSLGLCLPNGEPVSPEIVADLLPVDPMEEQKQGGAVLLLTAALTWGAACLLPGRAD